VQSRPQAGPLPRLRAANSREGRKHPVGIIPPGTFNMRYGQLDSLRGLAACSVVLCHATNVLPGVYDDPHRSWWLTQTPLALLRAGHAAVIFFFVLSGFVLTLPFLKGPVSYPSFLARRICRIWIPYATAMVAAVCCATCVSSWARNRRPACMGSPSGFILSFRCNIPAVRRRCMV